MQINGMNSYNTSFKGRVYMDYNKTATQIERCPYSTQESIIGNINTLTHRLETQTPDYKTFILNFDYNGTRKTVFEPTFHSASISVKDENGNALTKKFELGQTGGSHKDNRTQLLDGEGIWQKGFKEITEKALTSLPKSDNDELINRLARNNYSSEWIEEHLSEIQDIYNKIENRGKVHMDKVEIAMSIFDVTKKECVPNEIRESIIGNINTLTKRVEEETAKEKIYNLSVTNNYHLGNWDEGNHYDSLKIEISTNNHSYQRRYLHIISTDKESRKDYCCTDSEEIYQRIFKPITEKTLWDGHHYLPFDNDYPKREIVNRLD